MARSARAHTPVVVHPARESRIERAAKELFDLRGRIKELETAKDELNSRLCTMIRLEGEKDLEGKIRYETDLHRFQIVPGKNVSVNLGKLRLSMAAQGLTPKQIGKILAPEGVVKTVEYEYPGVWKKDAAGAADGDEDKAAS